MITINNLDLNIKNEELGFVNKYLLFCEMHRLLYPLKHINTLIFHLHLPLSGVLGLVRMPHPYSIIINPKAQFGKNVTVYQNVTVGSKQFGLGAGVPTIMDNVIIYPGSIIIGNLTIGKNAIIGAGSVVLKDVKENTIVAGNPAKEVGIIVGVN